MTTTEGMDDGRSRDGYRVRLWADDGRSRDGYRHGWSASLGSSACIPLSECVRGVGGGVHRCNCVHRRGLECIVRCSCVPPRWLECVVAAAPPPTLTEQLCPATTAARPITLACQPITPAAPHPRAAAAPPPPTTLAAASPAFCGLPPPPETLASLITTFEPSKILHDACCHTYICLPPLSPNPLFPPSSACTRES